MSRVSEQGRECGFNNVQSARKLGGDRLRARDGVVLRIVDEQDDVISRTRLCAQGFVARQNERRLVSDREGNDGPDRQVLLIPEMWSPRWERDVCKTNGGICHSRV